MNRLCVVLVLIASGASADVLVPELPSVACAGKRAGEACSATGRCEARAVRRPDFSTSPPSWSVVEVLVCVERPLHAVRSLAPASAVLLLVAALALWRRRRLVTDVARRSRPAAEHHERDDGGEEVGHHARG